MHLFEQHAPADMDAAAAQIPVIDLGPWKAEWFAPPLPAPVRIAIGVGALDAAAASEDEEEDASEETAPEAAPEEGGSKVISFMDRKKR